MDPTSDKTLKKVNLGLTVVVVVLGIYIILFPFLPHISLWIANLTDDTEGLVYQGQLSDGADVDGLKQPPETNTLVVPRIKIDEQVIVGDDPSNVHRGIWHRPDTSTPEQGGNTVLVGHRFSYSDPAVFYHLDKMQVGDEFAVWWDDKEYVYNVFETSIVPASAIEIEANSEDPVMTLYTCTPLWTAKDRLVIKAELVNTEILEQE